MEISINPGRKRIKKNKTSYEKIINQAINFHIQGNITEAVKYYQYCINQGFDDHRVFSNYGVILQSNGKFQEAELSYRKAIEINPDYAEAHSNLGIILKDLGKLQEAELSTRKAIEIKSYLSEAHYNLANILKDLSKLEEAELSTRKAIELKPDFAEAYSNLGNILSDLKRLNEAELSYRKAIELKSDFAEAHSNLGNVLQSLGELNKAEQSLRKAIELKSDSAEAHNNLGNILKENGNYADAINSFKNAIKLNSALSNAKVELIGSKKEICDWNDDETHNIWLKDLGIKGVAVKPWGFFFLEDSPNKHLKRSKNYFNENFVQKSSPIASFKNKKIHIGYFSADFYEHATMYLIASILELHDKSKFKIYLYSFTLKEDKYTERAKKSGCIFRNIEKLSTIKSVELARSDKLDIAIDLKGYTKHSRMEIFAYKVAPIQINYLGYPGTLGAKTINYLIADKITIPKEYEKFYSEKIIRMPNCFQCNDNKKEIFKETLKRSDFNLPKEGFVFTCFNSSKKISSKEFDIWMKLLKEIKGSVLWLYKSNMWAVENLCKEAEKRNVDSNRLIFAEYLPLNKHLARYSLGDLGLDTFNCNGHTTTSDALWGGLPVLTKIGKSFAARVSASLLSSINLSELITSNEKEYEEKALNIARNPDKLIHLKSKLAKSRETASLYNSELFTKDIENKFIELYK